MENIQNINLKLTNSPFKYSYMLGVGCGVLSRIISFHRINSCLTSACRQAFTQLKITNSLKMLGVCQPACGSYGVPTNIDYLCTMINL
ncbi:MAG: hypothetical protein LAT51_00380, partial [Flavobacteriaceae bacterium]|nr:hypothetical protein [Flavobacteriaceae bacterium]